MVCCMKIHIFYNMYLFLLVLGLCCYLKAFPSCREWGYSLLPCGFLIVMASHCVVVELGPQGTWASVVIVCGLGSCGLWALESGLCHRGARAWLLRSMWVLPRPGIEPMSPASVGRFLPLDHQGSPENDVSLNTKITLKTLWNEGLN